MFWRREYLRTLDGITTLVPYILQLPRSGKLGSLLLKITASDVTGLGQGGGNWRPIDFISKISVIVNGATVVKSLTGYEVAALEFWDQGVMSPSRWRMYATNEQTQWLLINFGRWLKDFNLGLDLAKYNSAELRIENTFTAASLTGMTVSVVGEFLEDAPADQFIGYMRTEEWRSWVTVLSQTVYNEIPTDYILRRIMLQARPHQTLGVFDANMLDLMSTIALSLDTGGRTVFLGGLQELMRENAYYMGRFCITGGLFYPTLNHAVDFSTGYGLFRAGISGTKDGTVSTVIPTITADENAGSQTAVSYSGDEPIEMVNIGIAPYHTALFNFDDDADPSGWLDPNARKVVKLDISTSATAGAVAGTNAIVLDRLVRS